MCQKCSDLTDKCPHGVQDEKPCMAGCDMDVPYRRDDNMDVVQVDIGVPSETEEAPTGNTGSTGSETDMTGVDEDVVGGASPSETGSTTGGATGSDGETGPDGESGSDGETGSATGSETGSATGSETGTDDQSGSGGDAPEGKEDVPEEPTDNESESTGPEEQEDELSS